MKKVNTLHANDGRKTPFITTFVGKNGITAHTYEKSWESATEKVDEALLSPFCLRAYARNEETGERYPIE